MIEDELRQNDPRMRAAIAELQALILVKYPDTTFTLSGWDESDGVFVRAVVDVDDPDEVTEIVIDRMVDLLVDDGLPIYVVPVRTPAREAAERRRQQEARSIFGSPARSG